MYDFNKIIDRTGSGDLKHEVLLERYGRADLLPLWVADMDFETPTFITEALRHRLDHSLFGYTVEPKNYWPTVQQWLHDHHRWNVELEWLSFIPGIVKGIGMVINIFTQPGDKVIIQPPVYHPFRLTPQGNGREVVYNPLKENADGSYSMDFDNLAQVADDKCKVLILSNPHNPAGIVWDKATLARWPTSATTITSSSSPMRSIAIWRSGVTSTCRLPWPPRRPHNAASPSEHLPRHSTLRAL